MATLRLVPPSGAAIEISRDQNVVGRDPTCDVVLSDGSISRRHARIEKRGADWAVVDQGSANGTFLDSQRVAEVVLKNGQELRFGALGFRVEITGGPDLTTTVSGVRGPEVTVVATPPPLPPRPPAAAPAPKPEPPRASPPPPVPRDRFRPPPPRSPSSPSPVPQMGAPPAPARKGRGPFFWIATGCCGCLTLLLVLFGLIGGGVFLMTRGAVDAVQGQIREIKAGRVAEAYDSLASSYRERLSQAEFERLVARHPGLGTNSQALFWPPVGRVKVENDYARISGVLVAISGEREDVTFELVKERGAWRISNIRFAGGDESSSAAPSQAPPPGPLVRMDP